jgi:Ca-activated chloride channel homolog
VKTLGYLLLLFLAGLVLASGARGSELRGRRWAANVIMPQVRSFRIDRTRSPVAITKVVAGVVILEQVATTTLDIHLSNPASRQQQAELLLPVPAGAVLRGFTFQGAGKEPSAKLLPKAEARRIYDSIVAKLRDPALLEFAGLNLVRSSVFPVPARGTQKLRLTYEQVLPADGARIDYFLPRSESLNYHVPWEISVRVKSRRAISTVYSPSHRIETRRASKHVAAVRLGKGAGNEPGPFRLSYMLEQLGVSASLMAYPDPKVGGGYFLLLAGLPAGGGKARVAIKREVTLVLDRSGSMNGEKLSQVREAALQIIAGLEPGEYFNVIVYNEGVDSIWSRPMAKDAASEAVARKYLKSLTARGGTNIHDALLEALRPKPRKGLLPIVLFLTDGRPTVGQTSEKSIRDLAARHNRHQRRVFTFGVGLNVNTPLLEGIASATRATASFVLPKENIELKIAAVFKRLCGPVLADAVLEVCGPDGKVSPGRVRDVMPLRLPDMFDGDQLVVLGQYVGEKPIEFRLSGNYQGRKRSFRLKFKLDKATTRHSFVPRLWASRKIAVLSAAIRAMGADMKPGAAVRSDPRFKELVEEIVRLSTEFGILTEYTSFLAREGTDLGKKDAVIAEARRNFVDRAMRARFGMGSVNQDRNLQSQKAQTTLNLRNKYFDANLQRVQVARVQQVNDRAFYRRGNRWVDSRLVENSSSKKPDRVVAFGSKEYRALVSKMVRRGRQGSMSLKGEIMMEVDGQAVLVK